MTVTRLVGSVLILQFTGQVPSIRVVYLSPTHLITPSRNGIRNGVRTTITY
jgi:hypothetical protein